MKSVQLTDRALEDLEYIFTYSTNKCGQIVADRYIADIETALNLIKENPKIIKQKEQISKDFSFYNIREHILVLVELDNCIIVLTIKHAAMDLPTRINDLEPSLLMEAEILYKKLIRNSDSF